MSKKNKIPKKMNKLVVIAILVISILVIVNACGIIGNAIRRGEEKDIVKKINDNSNLPVTYMEEYNEKDPKLKKYQGLKNFMSNDYYDDDIWFSYYGYSNDESSKYLAKIVLYSNKYDILGVKEGDNYKDSIEKIEEYGFKVEDKDTEFEATLVLNNISITLENRLALSESGEDMNTVGKITLEAKSDYLGNRLY